MSEMTRNSTVTDIQLAQDTTQRLMSNLRDEVWTTGTISPLIVMETLDSMRAMIDYLIADAAARDVREAARTGDGK
jgi:hypothetical protein